LHNVLNSDTKELKEALYYGYSLSLGGLGMITSHWAVERKITKGIQAEKITEAHKTNTNMLNMSIKNRKMLFKAFYLFITLQFFSRKGINIQTHLYLRSHVVKRFI